jgi:hypothetical protein
MLLTGTSYYLPRYVPVSNIVKMKNSDAGRMILSKRVSGRKAAVGNRQRGMSIEERGF